MKGCVPVKAIKVFLVVLFLAFSSGCSSDEQSKGANDSSISNEEAVQRWEYEFLPVGSFYDDDTLSKFNELGKEGWELVLNHDGRNFIFKRPLTVE
jgi:hypothetical protein